MRARPQTQLDPTFAAAVLERERAALSLRCYRCGTTMRRNGHPLSLAPGWRGFPLRCPRCGAHQVARRKYCLVCRRWLVAADVELGYWLCTSCEVEHDLDARAYHDPWTLPGRNHLVELSGPPSYLSLHRGSVSLDALRPAHADWVVWRVALGSPPEFLGFCATVQDVLAHLP